MGQPAQRAGVPAGDQFYVTHCTTADSVLNNPGYTVRAASPGAAPELLDAAFHYPPYELPLDMWRDSPPVALAPRRLARIEREDEGVWAVHSAYLEKDTVGRDRSYFSHLILFDDADPADVLRSWGASAWAKSYAAGLPKELPPKAKLPTGTLIDDAAITAFLNDDPEGPLDLSLTVCPRRLRGDTQTRRDLLARFLQAMCLLAEEEDEDRKRLYVHAEPGLTALLLYGAVRLLPDEAIADLTFSTFEPYHRNIRDYKLASVVGTYLGTTEKGLEPDLGTQRGVALDTFNARWSSPELRKPLEASLPDGITELIELVAAGEWRLLPQVRSAIGPKLSGLPEAGRAIARARFLARLDDTADPPALPRPTVEELVEFQKDKVSAKELESRAEIVWPLVKKAVLTQPDVRKKFQWLVSQPDRLKELWRESRQAILEERYRDWDARWATIRAAVGTDKARQFLQSILENEGNEQLLAKLPTDTRHKFRAACSEVALLPPRPLLVPIGLGELEPLLGAAPGWAGYTAFVLMADDAHNWLPHIPEPDRARMRSRARDFLFTAPPEALAAYIAGARPFLDTDPSFLTVLFGTYSEPGARLMDGLLSSNLLEPGDWMKLCGDEVGLTRGEWGEFLLKGQRLANLLVGLGGDGIGRGVWQGYLEALTPALVSPDLIEVEEGYDPQQIHEWERTVHAQLRAAGERLTASGVKLGHALPEGGVGRWTAANALVKWVDAPGSTASESPEEVAHACSVFGIDRLDLVRAAYRRGGFDSLAMPERAKELDPLIALFRACFPLDERYHTAKSAVTQWLRLSAECPAGARAAFQAYFVIKFVPEMHLSDLLDESRAHPFEPAAEARIRQELRAIKAKKGAAGGAKPAKPTRARADEDDAGFADEETPEDADIIVKPGKKRNRARAKKSGCGAGLFFIAVVVAAVGALIARAG